jgi:hypothetical protein
MMIYNLVDVPVMVTIGDQTFRMEKDGEKEVKLPAGDYFFSIYKIDPYTDEPMRKYKTDYYPSTGLDFHRGKWGRHGMMRYDEGYDSTAICYGTSARLTLCRATKLYIRDTYSNSLIFRLSNERYFADLFEFQLEEGEFSFRKDGLPDEQTRTKLLHSIYLQFVGSMLKGLSFIGLLALLAFFGLRYGMKELAAVLTAEPDSLVLIIAPILYIAFVGYDIYKFRHAKEIKNLPLMPTKEEYDYL